MRLRDLMRTQVTTVASDDTLHFADAISLAGVRHLPVVAGGALVGLVTQHDVLRAAMVYLGPRPEIRAALWALSVRNVMAKDVVSAGAAATAGDTGPSGTRRMARTFPL
jgi:predicted transcriptional regulator